MRTSSAFAFSVALLASPGLATEARPVDPASLFATAFTAYATGDTATALAGYRDAARLGHLPAAWKLARMYESGDGVDRSDARAFELYRDIARRFGSIRPRDRDAVYVSSAFLHLAHYFRDGIEGGIAADPTRARLTFFYAASYFGDADAQFELGSMMMAGAGGPRDQRNGLRWLNSAAEKGHTGAAARLGSALFHGRGTPPRRIDGLAMLLRAAVDAREVDRGWIEALRDAALEGATREVAAEAESRNAPTAIEGS